MYEKPTTSEITNKYLYLLEDYNEFVKTEEYSVLTSLDENAIPFQLYVAIRNNIEITRK